MHGVFIKHTVSYFYDVVAHVFQKNTKAVTPNA
jgi:hypothetical protein